MEAVPLLIFLTCFGFAEGIYDANIWASMYDVVHPSRRATMLGFANMIGWLGGGVATVGTGMVITRFAHDVRPGALGDSQHLRRRRGAVDCRRRRVRTARHPARPGRHSPG